MVICEFCDLRYYNGFMDNASNLDYVYANGSDISPDSVQSSIASISVTLAQFLYTLVTGKTEPPAVNSSVVKLVSATDVATLSKTFGC